MAPEYHARRGAAKAGIPRRPFDQLPANRSLCLISPVTTRVTYCSGFREASTVGLRKPALDLWFDTWAAAKAGNVHRSPQCSANAPLMPHAKRQGPALGIRFRTIVVLFVRHSTKRPCAAMRPLSEPWRAIHRGMNPASAPMALIHRPESRTVIQMRGGGHQRTRPTSRVGSGSLATSRTL